MTALGSKGSLAIVETFPCCHQACHSCVQQTADGSKTRSICSVLSGLEGSEDPSAHASKACLSSWRFSGVDPAEMNACLERCIRV